ncbi:MAG: fibronectin type III domain-containing protein [Microthrixaceae bacterium]
MLNLLSHAAQRRAARSGEPLTFRTRLECLRSGSGRGQHGIALLEVVLAVALAALIIVPLAMVFTSVWTNGAGAQQRFKRSGDAQRIGEAWTRDVQSVDPEGVNEPAGDAGRCINTSVDDTDELERVSFNWDLEAAEGQSTVRRTSTWLLKGYGDNVKLIRRYCEDLVLVQERVLASDMDVADAGGSRSQLVRGPGSPSDDFCPPDPTGTPTASNPTPGAKTRCTIEVNADFDYEITVTRRVPDMRTAVISQFKPPPPQNLSHDARYGYVNVYWDPPSMAPGQFPVDMYRLEVREGSPNGPLAVPLIDTPANGTGRQMFKVEPLNLDTDYYVVMRAHNTMGWGEESSPPYGPMTPVPVPPDAPTITGVVAGSNNDATVSWTHAANDGGRPVNSYAIWAYKEGDDPNNPANLLGPFRPSPDGEATSGVVTGLDSFVKYYFIVADYNEIGEGEHSAPSTTATLAYGNTVFVNHLTGTNNFACGPKATPCASIAYAQTKVSGANPTVAVAASGSGPRFTLQPGITVWGGFPDSFLDTPSPSARSTIGDGSYSGVVSGVSFYNATTGSTIKNLKIQRSNQSASTQTAGIDVSNAAGMIIENVNVTGGQGDDPTGLRIRSGSNVNMKGSSIASGSALGTVGSAYGVRVLSGSQFTVDASTISAAAGTQGTPGGTGGNSSSTGCPGGNGSGSSGGGHPGNCGPAPWGGNGGNSTANGAAGQSMGGAGSPGGGGGGVDDTWSCATPGSTNGDPGGRGNPGGGGPGGSASGGSSGINTGPLGETWSAVAGGIGNTGNTGGPGGGGGGGGGGDRSRKWGGSWGLSCSTYDGGGGGAGGGGGKVGGLGGTGGSIGGGSFAIYVKNASVNVTNSTLSTSTGGKGGTGGSGGKGSTGGAGGNGASVGNGAGTGGRGAGGGGAGGGAGGTGGRGGPSIAVFRSGSGATTATSNTYTVGNGGPGGNGGSGGAGGGGGAGGTSGGGGAAAGGGGGTGSGGSTGPGGPRCAVWTGNSCTTPA